MLSRKALIGAATVWIACLVYASLRPLRIAPAPRSMPHRMEHVVAFVILGLLLLPLCRGRGQQWLVSLAIIGLAAAMELAQHLIFFHVEYEWFDVRDDAIGVVIALLIVRAATQKRSVA